MATPQQLLADSLEELRKLQASDPHIVIKGTEQLSRTHLKRLLDNGWLQEVMKGWYVPSRPGSEGDTTVWYTSYWHFVRAYANSKFGVEWCLSPEMSLDIHSGKTTVPGQLIIKSPKANNNVVQLPFGHSLLSLRADIDNGDVETDMELGLNVYSLEYSLTYASPAYYRNDAVSARVCLALLEDSSNIMRILTRNGATTRAGRITGALRAIGNNRLADDILTTMKDFGYSITEENPFEESHHAGTDMPLSPYVGRLRLMWKNMRQQVIDNFPEEPKPVADLRTFLARIDDKYLEDAYHSLSIEGYQVSRELIEKVRSGNWKPDDEDSEHRNALVARGYYQAFQTVKESVKTILSGENSGHVVKDDHSRWYRQMWMPFVTAGILTPADLIGYRTSQVYIRGSQHIPLNPKTVPDAMSEFFRLLSEETDARVRAVLGHFMFVFIHPYMDGNGRMGRFILNTMLASGGYPWTVIPVEKRKEYMRALEKASVNSDISDFTRIIADLTIQKNP